MKENISLRVTIQHCQVVGKNLKLYEVYKVLIGFSKVASYNKKVLMESWKCKWIPESGLQKSE